MKFNLHQFCPPNETLIPDFHLDKGVSQCFMETVVSSSALIYMLTLGIVQLMFYRKYATAVQHYALPFSQLFGLQMILNGIVPVILLIHLIVELGVFKPGVMYGYHILQVLQAIIVWPIVLVLILWERKYMLPTPPSRGHGVILLIFWTGAFAVENLMLLNLRTSEWFFKLKNIDDIVYFCIFVIRYVVVGGIFFLGLKAPGIPSIRNSESFARLHPNGDEEEMNSSHGSPFRNLCKKMQLLAPFIWPKRSAWLQLSVILSVMLLILGRATNIFVPLYSKKIVDSMTILTNTTTEYGDWKSYAFTAGSLSLAFRWDYILIYVGLKVVQGGGAGGTGLLNNLRSLLWISVEQFTTREVQVHFFEHLHQLSLRWHLQRKTGEVLRAMDRGTDSINNILNYLLFSILPTIADIIIAIVYLSMFFNGWFGLIVFVTMILYLICTFWITEWRTKFRRSMNQADNEQRQQAIDSLLNFETVKYYANEKYETERYSSSIVKYQKEEWKVTASVALLNFLQLIIINAGLLTGSLLCVHMVVKGEGLTVGDYVLFTAYLMQLYAPLNYFGTYYRMLQKCFIDMENMLDLFKETAEVNDAPGARDLMVTNGVIEFRNVSFNYVLEKTILSNISFVVPAGQSVALVGPSGGGKSTIIRLLFRFYDPISGEIFIDGQNIKLITQLSLRKAVGVVPQDTVLFNDTIKYNILYGRMDAEDEGVFKAAEGACIHEKIMTFPDRYDSKVGERGLKLSGGEKQRVAIARTILKSPAVILLDEATSALDTQTERQIQSSLQLLCANRTSVIVAHRLSTIVNCDQILVIKDGSIVEGGTHDTLMSENGVYAGMWNEQLKSEFSDKDINNGAGTANNEASNSSTNGIIKTTAEP